VKKILGSMIAVALFSLASASTAKPLPSAPDCSWLDNGGCVYSWDPDSSCCLAPGPEPGQFCPNYCYL
jgi:hypothetical protein